MTTYYSISDGQLRVSCDEPFFEWTGFVDSMPVAEVRPLLDGSSALLLLDPRAGAIPVQNLVKVDERAQVVWRGELPTNDPGECFVSVDIGTQGTVNASTWSGYRVVLSQETGQIRESRFAK